MKTIRSLHQILMTTLLASLCQPAEALDDYGIDLGFEAECGRLAGMLFLPPGNGPFLAAIFLAGSGDESCYKGWEGEPESAHPLL